MKLRYFIPGDFELVFVWCVGRIILNNLRIFVAKFWNILKCGTGFFVLMMQVFKLVTLKTNNQKNKTALLTTICNFYYIYFYSFRCVFMIFKLMQSDFTDCTYASLFIWKLGKTQVSAIIFWRSWHYVKSVQTRSLHAYTNIDTKITTNVFYTFLTVFIIGSKWLQLWF